jgi:hypothetical protein
MKAYEVVRLEEAIARIENLIDRIDQQRKQLVKSLNETEAEKQMSDEELFTKLRSRFPSKNEQDVRTMVQKRKRIRDDIIGMYRRSVDFLVYRVDVLHEVVETYHGQLIEAYAQDLGADKRNTKSGDTKSLVVQKEVDGLRDAFPEVTVNELFYIVADKRGMSYAGVKGAYYRGKHTKKK